MTRSARLARYGVVITATFAWLLSCGGSGLSRIDGPVSESGAASEVAKRLCREWRRCDCGELAGVPLTNCETGMRFAFESLQQDAQESGLTYDGDCLARKLNAMLDRGCDPLDPFDTGFGCSDDSCAVYSGTKSEGEDCDGSFGSSDCEPGLSCLGTCEDPCSSRGGILDEGDRCSDDTGALGTCRPPGLVCDPDSGLCVTLPTDGEPCAQNQCAEDHYCDPRMTEATCRTAKAAGASCELPIECASRDCADGTCTALPGAGSPCLQNVVLGCADGLGCVDGTCVEAPGENEPCPEPTSGSAVLCAPGLVCGGKLCATAPKTPGCNECDEPPDRCVVRVCTPEPPAVCADSGGLLF